MLLFFFVFLVLSIVTSEPRVTEFTAMEPVAVSFHLDVSIRYPAALNMKSGTVIKSARNKRDISKTEIEHYTN